MTEYLSNLMLLLNDYYLQALPRRRHRVSWNPPPPLPLRRLPSMWMSFSQCSPLSATSSPTTSPPSSSATRRVPVLNASVKSPKSRSRSSSSRGLAESLDDSVDAVTFASEGGRAAAAGEAAEDRHRIDSDAEEDLDPMNDPMALLY